MYEVIFIEVFSQSNDFIRDLFLANFQLLQNTQKETFFFEVCIFWSQKVWIAGSRGGRNFFSKQKKVLIKIRNISHLLSCKFPRKFIS